MEKTRTILPPIQSLAAGMPILSLETLPPVQAPPPPPQIIPQTQIQNQFIPQNFRPQPKPVYAMQQPLQKGKPTTFTAAEDLSILKAMRLYLGKNVSLKIPWSFWQLYRRFTGSQRSDSSLYHHWNGAMIKKYGNFIKEGRIDDCIKWAESALDIEAKSDNDVAQIPPQRALIHTQSHQIVPPSLFGQMDQQEGQPRQLMHFQSLRDIGF